MKAILCLLFVAATCTDCRADVDVQNSNIAVVKAIDGGYVASITWLVIPRRASSEHAVSARDLGTSYFYELTVRMPYALPALDKLKAVLNGHALPPAASAGDLRWGCVLKDSDGRELSAIALSRDLKTGAVNERAVQIPPELAKWFAHYVECVDSL